MIAEWRNGSNLEGIGPGLTQILSLHLPGEPGLNHEEPKATLYRGQGSNQELPKVCHFKRQAANSLC